MQKSLSVQDAKLYTKVPKTCIIAETSLGGGYIMQLES